jgi:hypothetical protein
LHRREGTSFDASVRKAPASWGRAFRKGDVAAHKALPSPLTPEIAIVARPRKQPHERRSHGVGSDLTLAEKLYVQGQAAQAGLSEAEYTRRRVLGYAVKAASPGKSDPALVSEVNRLGVQLSSLGNLANQIALYCHTDRQIPASWSRLPSEIKLLLQLVEQTLQKLLSDHGSKDS